jgi:hypothetical protein
MNGEPEVNAVDSIAAIAERDGSAALPALTQADLCALGAADKSLVCQRTWDWWLGLGERGRAEMAAKSLELLAFRKLIVPVRGGVPAVPVPELGMILSARSYPEPLVTCQVPGADAALNPRFFGMTQARIGLRVLVCELLTERPSGPGDHAEFGTMLSYTLVTPAWAAKVLAAWARVVGDFGTGEPPVIDIFARDGDGRLARDRYEVCRDGEFFDVRRPATALPPERLDEMQVTQLLTAALIGAAG